MAGSAPGATATAAVPMAASLVAGQAGPAVVEERRAAVVGRSAPTQPGRPATGAILATAAVGKLAVAARYATLGPIRAGGLKIAQPVITAARVGRLAVADHSARPVPLRAAELRAVNVGAIPAHAARSVAPQNVPVVDLDVATIGRMGVGGPVAALHRAASAAEGRPPHVVA